MVRWRHGEHLHAESRQGSSPLKVPTLHAPALASVLAARVPMVISASTSVVLSASSSRSLPVWHVQGQLTYSSLQLDVEAERGGPPSHHLLKASPLPTKAATRPRWSALRSSVSRGRKGRKGQPKLGAPASEQLPPVALVYTSNMHASHMITPAPAPATPQSTARHRPSSSSGQAAPRMPSRSSMRVRDAHQHSRLESPSAA